MRAVEGGVGRGRIVSSSVWPPASSISISSSVIVVVRPWGWPGVVVATNIVWVVGRWSGGARGSVVVVGGVVVSVSVCVVPWGGGLQEREGGGGSDEFRCQVASGVRLTRVVSF